MSAVQSEVTLTITSKSARLVLTKAGRVVEDEAWHSDSAISQTEAHSAATAVFGNLYDFLNYTFNGD